MLKKIYTVVKFALCIFIIGLSVFIDGVLIGRGSYGLLCVFILLEILMLVYSFLLFRYINKTVIKMYDRDGHVFIETLGSSYRTRLNKIQIIKGRLNYYILKFDDKSLRVYQSNRDVNAFIKKYFVRISS